MFNATTRLPDLFLSETLKTLKNELTPKEHPIENKIMYWLHECNFAKCLPIETNSNQNILVLWLTTINEHVLKPNSIELEFLDKNFVHQMIN